jgi:hypothetical protein
MAAGLIGVQAEFPSLHSIAARSITDEMFKSVLKSHHMARGIMPCIDPNQCKATHRHTGCAFDNGPPWWVIANRRKPA